MSRILYFCSYSSSLVKWAFFDSKSPIEFDGMRTNFSTLASEAVEASFMLPKSGQLKSGAKEAEGRPSEATFRVFYCFFSVFKHLLASFSVF